MKSTDGKSQRGEEKRREEKRSKKNIKKRKSPKKEDPGARKSRKVAKHCVFPMIYLAPEGRKLCSLKRRVRLEPAGQMRDVKLHAVLARNTFPSQNLQNTSGSEPFSRMRSKGSRFTLGVWGLRVCSLDVAFTSATVRNRPQPSARGPYGRAYGKFCRGGPFWRF